MPASAASSRSATIEAHLPLVRSIAQRYIGHGEPLDDLVQVGTVGLIKAVDRFDPARDAELAALARPSIEGEIRHHLRDRGAGPHVPRTDRELAARVRAAEAGLTARLRRPATPAELAQAVGVDEREIVRALQAHDAAHPVALDEDDVAQRVPAARADTEAAEARVLLEAGWDILDERERRLLELRYREDRSQSEIARDLGLSQAHVSRLLRATLERLRGELDPAPIATEQHGPRPAPAPVADGRSGRLLLRLPRSLHADLAVAAEREGVPLNTFIAGTLAAAVGWQDPDERPRPKRAHPPSAGRPSRLLLINAIVIAVATLTGIALLVQAWLA